LMKPFKDSMVAIGKRTTLFPNRYDVVVREDLHTATYRYTGSDDHEWTQVTEGLGNKSWIAEWMYANSGVGRTFYEWVGWDTALSVVNDVIAEGAMPVVYTDMIAARDSEWFADTVRTDALGEGVFNICEEVGMALVGGETQSARYLVNPEIPVKSAPILSGSVVGVIAPSARRLLGRRIQVGDSILGVTSSGLHCNGISLVIKRALSLPDQFLTKISTATTLGEEALIPTRSYVALVEALLEAEIKIHAIVPGTGDGVAKLAFDKRPLTYRIGDWPVVPMIFQFFRDLGVTIEDCLKTFNWGIGYYVIVPPSEVNRAINIGTKAGYEIMEVGRVEEGERQVIFEPEEIALLPQGE
jgi:phosphoribosylformylglycinamidine cyclo-ligase